MWYFLYNFSVIPSLYLVFRAGYYFNEKIRKGVDGRKNVFQNLAAQVASWKDFDKLVWLHSASLGEFEQGKPLIAALKKKYGERIKIVVSFFSPSGYEHARNYPLADLVFYLPFDTPTQARKIIELLRPNAWLLLKYDAWPNHVWAAARAQIPIFLVSAALPETSGRLYPVIRSLHRNVYRHFKGIFAISQDDAQRFQRLCSDSVKVIITGETRYDQVYLRSQTVLSSMEHGGGNKGGSASHSLLYALYTITGRKLIAGSTWERDEKYLIPAFKNLSLKYPDLQLILVPHEPSPSRLEFIVQELKRQNLTPIYSSRITSSEIVHSAKVIIVDEIGILASLYATADITFVGGGFGSSIHNVMEPSVMGKPVLFGPVIHKAPEAIQLVKHRGGFIINNEVELIDRISELLDKPELLKQTGEAAKNLILSNLGATDRIMKHLEEYL
jgi:3-deoxy-D-manno-octulosonic-acid transferase